MATPQPKDPLDVLQAMFNEVLVQTGKAIKASQKDGARNGASAGAALRTQMPATMRTYHYALDDLESEITRAKAVLLRDLGKLQAARAPPPIPSPVAPPAPMEPEPQQPAAMMMMDMPSAAAHTVNTNINFQPIKEETKRAPFPDMGMGLSGDVGELSSTTKAATPSPRPPSGTLKPTAGGRGTPPTKKSPKPTIPAKVTPVPVPQIPQLLSPSAVKKVVSPQPPPPAAPIAQDSSLDAMLALPPGGGAATADMTGGELNFTNMEFTLAPATEAQAQNAPPAPMQDFDLSSFTAQDTGADLLTMDTAETGGIVPAAAPAEASGTTPGKAAENTASATNLDSMYDLSNIDGGNVEHMDLDLNLEGDSGVNDSTFNDLFFEDADGDMGQFNDAYFGLE